MFKQSVLDIRESWVLYRQVQDKSRKRKVLVLLYMNIGFLLVYAALCYVSLVYAIAGVVGGMILGFRESPWWFLLTLLPPFGFVLFYFVHLLGKTQFRKALQDYQRRHHLMKDD
ncbi:hypothetical protein AB1K83_00545 [Sporosarcina sp. 179-K 3D1 HS]